MIYPGTGICEVERIKHLLDKYGDRFLEFIFSEREVNYSLKKPCPEVHPAGRFSAKMAVKKCLFGAGLRVLLGEIEVIPMQRGGVEVGGYLNSRIREELSCSVKINISHSRKRAIAIALLIPWKRLADRVFIWR